MRVKPGASGVARTFWITGESAFLFGLEADGEGVLRLTLDGHDARIGLLISPNGQVVLDGVERLKGKPPAGAVSGCVRILRPDRTTPELELKIWRDTTLELHEQLPLPFAPTRLLVSLEAGANKPIGLRHLDFWTPKVIQVEAAGDSHLYCGRASDEDPLTPSLSGPQFNNVPREKKIGRVLAMPYHAAAIVNGFATLSELAVDRAGEVFSLFRFQPWEDTSNEERFQINQLELLWQLGRMHGLKIHMKMGERPTAEVLDWMDRTQTLSLWHVTSTEDLDWIEREVLQKTTFPVLLAHFGGYPLDQKRYRFSLDLMSRYTQVYLVTSCVFFEPYLVEAIKTDAHRVLLGSDFPAIDMLTARSVIDNLPISDEQKILVRSENLRFLTERVQHFRWRALQEKNLLFPKLPQTAEELDEQGFEIVPVHKYAVNEFVEAKRYWRDYGVRDFYKELKPWTRYLVDLVQHLQPESVLEFGCNVGRNLNAIRAVLPTAKLVGFDINAEAVAHGREETGLDLRVADETSLRQFETGAFDFVFTISVLDHISNIENVVAHLLHTARRHAFFLEVTLPREGKVVRHFDHKAQSVRNSTGASYSWDVSRFICRDPRVAHVDVLPMYLHSASLGPYYKAYFVSLAAQPRRLFPS
jgi:SAM-dependent methyltransferase